jgi:hypothetical protein
MTLEKKHLLLEHLNMWMMRERVFLGAGSLTPWVAQDAISITFLNIGFLNVWIG